jgi:hypothetical protein
VRISKESRRKTKNLKKIKEDSRRIHGGSKKKMKKVVVTNFVTNFLHGYERERKALDTMLWKI